MQFLNIGRRGWHFILISLVLFFVHLFFQNAFLGIGAFVVWLVGVFMQMRRWRVFGEDFFSRVLFGGIFVAALLVIVFVGELFFFGMFPYITLISFSLVSLGILFVPLSDGKNPFLQKMFDDGLLWLGVAFFTDVLILFLLFSARTDQAIISPWNFFSGELFVLFFFATSAFLFGAHKRQDDLSIGIAIFHTFTTLSVSVIVFAVGFGFDPFIHRAAEMTISSLGTIEPKRLLYSGQYAFVVAISQLTALPLKQIDIWLVPLFASVLLPLGGYIGLRDGWRLSREDAKMWWIVVLIFPFMLLTFTAPFTMTYAWFLALLFLVPAANTLQKQGGILLGSVACVLFHPLLALPTLLFSLGFFAYRNAQKTWKRFSLFGIMTLFIAVSVPLMFMFYQISQGQGVFIDGPFTRILGFLSLFRTPYADPYPFIPWYLDKLYDFRYLFPMVAFGGGMLSLPFLWKTHRDILVPYIGLIVGMMGSIFCVSTMFYFKDIISHEQAEFALRLLTAWYAIILPFFAVLLSRVAQGGKRRLICIFSLCVLVTHAWFFSYPQFNIKYPYFSPSVSKDDVAAVQEIEKQSEGKSYVVLSNQMTSAAALQEFGFAHYVPLDGEQVLWYAIPTGGVLYAYYTRIITEGPSEALFRQIHEKTGVERIYFLTYAYWPWYAGFFEALQETSSRSFSVSGGDVIIYEYSF